MPSKKTKRVATPQLPHPHKIPSYLGPTNLEGQHLAWRFSGADLQDPFGCHALDFAAYQSLWERMRAFEKMNTDELNRTGSYHDISVRLLSKLAKERLASMRLDDVEVVHSFRITGGCRLWCMKFGNIMSVLWWDPNHQVYLVRKKN